MPESGSRGTSAWIYAPKSWRAQAQKHWRSQRRSVVALEDRKMPQRGHQTRRAKTPAYKYRSRCERATGSGGSLRRAWSNAALEARRASQRSRRKAIVTCRAQGHTVDACTRTLRRAAASRGKKVLRPEQNKSSWTRSQARWPSGEGPPGESPARGKGSRSRR